MWTLEELHKERESISLELIEAQYEEQIILLNKLFIIENLINNLEVENG